MVLQFPACFKRCRAPKHMRAKAEPPLLCLAIRREFKENRALYQLMKNGEHLLPNTVRYYQPVFDAELWEQRNFDSFMVYRRKCNAKKDFPTLTILTLRNGDIEHPVFVDG
jgi:hypothetical protein